MNLENQPNGQTMPEESQNLEITNEISNQLNEAGKWGKFLAILGFVVMGLMVSGGFVMSIVMLFIPKVASSPMPFPPSLIGVFYLIMGAVYFFPILYLFRFSSGIRLAIATKNQNQLAKAFANLKSHYRFIGIFTIVMFSLYIVMFVVMILFGVFAGLNGGFPGFPV